MLTAYRVIFGGLRSLPRPLVLRFIVTLDDGAAPLGVGFDTLSAHWTHPALAERESEPPAVPPLGSLAGAGRGPARTAHLVPRLVEGEGGRLKQLRCRGDPVQRRDIDRQLWSVGVITQCREQVPPEANPVNRQ